jgi:transposase, IS5 family
MPRRVIGQLGWVDGELAKRGGRRPDDLAKVAAVIDWQPFARLLAGVNAAAKGEASYPPLMMFKVLLLQRWYTLSDPEMEAALWDRVSFMGFVGLSLSDETPDHSTIWRFRQKLEQGGLAERLFAELMRQLDARGLVVKQGTLIDASIISSAARRPKMDEGKVSPVDPDARFGATNERRRFVFGYKLHIAVDQGSSLIRRLLLTSANVQDVSVAGALLPVQAGTVYGDRAYDSTALRAELVAQGFGDGLMRRARKGQPLSAVEIGHNHALSLVRRTVEKVFGTVKRSYGFARMRYFNAARNRVAAILTCFSFNLRRSRRLLAA